MPKNILYTIARNSQDELINAQDAERGEDYTCPVCNKELILRKGTKKRPHFAHKHLTTNCTPETALHYGFKTLLANRIKKCIDKGESLPMTWSCELCHGKHEGDLVKRTTKVNVEHDLGVCQPDIALLNFNNSVIAVVEVVVTHAPEESVIAYYKERNIAMVVFKLKSDEDISLVHDTKLNPLRVSVCRNPKCKKCGMHMSKQKMLIIDAECWKCQAPMKVAALRGDAGYEGGFTQEDAKLANSKGAYLKERYSKTLHGRYIANTCRRCNAFVGQHYLFTDYIASYNMYPITEYEAGFYCPCCCHD